MNEQEKYEVIKALAELPRGNKDRAAIKLGCSKRHINRMLAGYKEKGKEYFVHGNKKRIPVNTTPANVRAGIVALYKSKYYNANFTHFTELLAEHEGINLSVSTVSSILEAEYILSPKVTKAKRKRIKRELAQLKQKAKTKKEQNAIQANLVAVEDAHSRRPRCAYFGELQQMDATPFEWVEGEIWHLHLAIDDASSRITGAYFDTQETLKGYYNVLYQILTTYGIPYKFLTDKRTVFTYKKKNSPSVDEDTYTQFAYACHQLGVELESTSVPQAKGRVERLNQTLQSRLPIELQLAGVTTIEAANEFLNSYIKKFNAKFALPIDGIKSVFEEQPSLEKINLLLAVLSERTVDDGHCIKFRNNYHCMRNAKGEQIHCRKGTKVMVIKAFDDNLFCCVNDSDVYALEIVPKRSEKSPAFDRDYKKTVPRKVVIPSMNHPWRKMRFGNFVKQQLHHSADYSA